MTAADLDRLDNLRAETIELREQLRRLRSASEVSAVNYSHTGEKCGTGDPVANAAVSVVDVEEHIMRNVLEMVEIIDQIPSVRSRRIFRRRYIDCCTWSQIADEFGFAEANNAARHVRRVKKAVF